jgi:SecD/SecF fusion protein
LVYGKLGALANIGLAANMIMIIAVLTALGATLTLPGIAGIALTLGMAVDSNVIIFERVREERAQGRSLVQSLDSGFQRALAAVVDANVTTLIAAVILFYMGTGPIRGFAVTLAIGIVTTVFTAFTLTRWLIAVWLRRASGRVALRVWCTTCRSIRTSHHALAQLGFACPGAASLAVVIGLFTS